MWGCYDPEVGDPLTPRQTEAIRLVALDLTNPEIADKMKISVRTVEIHITNLYKKAGVPSGKRLTLVRWWENGIK